MPKLGDFAATRLAGGPAKLSEYDGKVALVVNVASKCGKTPQYAGLEELWRAYRDRGFVVLGFPCNQFGDQEPGTSSEIAEFCSLTYDVSFPMFEKIDVNGADTDPLYVWLKNEAPGPDGEQIGWNFTKFLVDREGRVLNRFVSDVVPANIAASIESLL